MNRFIIAGGTFIAMLTALSVGCNEISHQQAPPASSQEQFVVDSTPSVTTTAQSVPKAIEPTSPVYHSLQEAIDGIKPLMSDERNQFSKGAGYLLAWSAGHLKLADVKVTKDETSFVLLQKDADEERGKRVCIGGSIIEISTSKTQLGKISEGELADVADHIWRFDNVGSSGKLVQGSSARICGVVIGKFDYSGSASNVVHAVQIIGMFDIPENREPVVKKTNHK